jgi:hypothetical protein
MHGSRKLVLGLYYLTGIFVIGGLVVVKHYDSLVGLAALAAGAATGVTAIVWGNIREHQAQKKGE